MSRAFRRSLLKSMFALALLVSVAALVAQLAGIGGTTNAGDGEVVFGENTNQWLVQLPDGEQSDTTARSLGRATDNLGGGKTGSELPGGWYEIRLSDDVTSSEAERTFGKAGALDVEPVVPRMIYDLDQPDAVSDPASIFSTEFHDKLRAGKMHATRLKDQWSLEQDTDVDIDGTEAWGASTGSGAVVAVIDTGVDASHPDLKGRVLPGKDFSGAGTGATYDAVGHGTHVASIIAAGGNVMAGVAPDAKIMPLKVFRDSPSGFQMSGYLQAIRYAADNGADVINISLGCGGTLSCFSQAESDALAYAAEKGVMVVAAAGNGDENGLGMNNDSSATPDYPSNYDIPNIISVTASTKIGGWSTWSNYGKRNVDLAAPGESILVASKGGGYASQTGTSFSAPHVSGALALLAASNQNLGVADLRARLLNSVDKVGELTDRTVTGGTLNANNPLRAAQFVADKGVNNIQVVAPKNNSRSTSPANYAWKLPSGWSSVRVELKSTEKAWKIPVPTKRKAALQPRSAWQSDTYKWRVIARTPSGKLIASRWYSYKLMPSTASWMSSGKLTADGRTLKLRLAYAATNSSATTRVRVLVGNKVLHSGQTISRSNHTRGVGFPRRAWFAYKAPLSQRLSRGTTVTVEVTVTSGSAKTTDRYTGKVS